MKTATVGYTTKEFTPSRTQHFKTDAGKAMTRERMSYLAGFIADKTGYTVTHINIIIGSKTFKYNVANDEMVIWQDGYPIYGNFGGSISTDVDALADCLC